MLQQGSSRDGFLDEQAVDSIGAGRSGTSLRRAVLNAHPRIYLAQEGPRLMRA